MEIALESGVCRSILETMPAAAYVVDRDRKILLWNDAAEKLSGYFRHEVIGRCCSDNILVHCNRHGTVLCGVDCPLAGTMHDGHPRDAEVFMLHKAGHRVPVRIRATPVRNEHGAVIGAVEIFEETEIAAAVAPQPTMQRMLEEQFCDFTARHIPFSVLFLQLENLDRFAERYGNRAVEEAMGVVVDTLARCTHRTDDLGWWTGHRLLVILPNCWPVAAAEVAESLKDLANHSAMHWWGERLTIPVAVGTATIRDEDTPASLLARCEERLHS